MYDPSMRVLTVLELLQAKEEVSGAELARRLEVSPRTVQRYVARLQDLGIPVEGRRGVGGAYRLRPGFRLPPLIFTGEEALSLSLGLLALHHLGLRELLPAAGSASAKLARTLPTPLRDAAQALEAAVQLDASAWAIPVGLQRLTELLRAVRGGLTVRLAYTDLQGRASEREVEVYRAVHLDGRWYAVGHCRLRGELRSFRLDRITALEVLTRPFAPRPDFDALAFLRGSLAEPMPRFQVDVWLAAPLDELRGQVSMWCAALEPEAGGTRLRTERERLSSFAAFLLGLGCEFRVDGPPELQEEFGNLAARCEAAYTSCSPSGQA
ncbi:Predicted DNA-binding transcriptional regulator YafY, contains an HTH and WYL domains [Deinococcus reticulitermitis]|uniref:Predicted DNA-binding transcriptional regulator YafY, contains an HTH and WYL domains n=1 Tax=Deinococcus reticulitermitis TaxID=856736 RepID=A0A1H6UWB4_9DEIO|nr:YafY family protein [Deinococcus reticulitermitis]SEI93937.1 Predicted DNA-binding transcriptional regulator YafY, contains an HTH and WYL domains [Deinococcus reticulitermitis]